MFMEMSILIPIIVGIVLSVIVVFLGAGSVGDAVGGILCLVVHCSGFIVLHKLMNIQLGWFIAWTVVVVIASPILIFFKALSYSANEGLLDWLFGSDSDESYCGMIWLAGVCTTVIMVLIYMVGKYATW
jgi:lysylphosphatidylglycerol synthetase-like protein (DUF2156 family)